MCSGLLILFFETAVNRRLLHIASDKISELKKEYEDKITNVFTTKNHSISVNVKSPFIILPVYRNWEEKSPIWFVRTGDLKINSKEVIFYIESNS
jgi:hypothetical protein